MRAYLSVLIQLLESVHRISPIMESEPVFEACSHVNGSSEPNRFLVEGKAMRSLLAAMEGQQDPDFALQLIEELHQGQPQDTPEELLRWYAMGRILGEPLPSPPRFDLGEDNEAEFFQTTAWAWMSWASGSTQPRICTELGLLKPAEEDPVIHLLALSNWSAAVQNLLQDNWSEARRMYCRAVDLGSQFGTNTSSAILWTYGATFFAQSVSRETLV